MRFRKLNKIIAALGGYFWLPCSECGQSFGGHEWQIRFDKPIANAEGKGICPDCTEAGRGSWPHFTFPASMLATTGSADGRNE